MHLSGRCKRPHLVGIDQRSRCVGIDSYKFSLLSQHSYIHYILCKCMNESFQKFILIFMQFSIGENRISVLKPDFRFSINFFFFLVLCLPRQVRMSNGAIHDDPQLSHSTCCNPLSASSPVTSFLVFLFSFSLPFFPRL